MTRARKCRASNVTLRWTLWVCPMPLPSPVPTSAIGKEAFWRWSAVPTTSTPCRRCCATAVIGERSLPPGFMRFCMTAWQCKLPNATSCTHLKFCRNAGSSSAVSLGWRKHAGFGRIVSDFSIAAYNLFFLLSLHLFSRDFRISRDSENLYL